MTRIYGLLMRLIRASILGVLVAALVAAPVMATAPAEYREAARSALRRAIKLDKAASANIPHDLDLAREQLESAADELMEFEGLALPSRNWREYKEVRNRASNAASGNQDVSRRIDEAQADGDVTQEELEHTQWVLRILLEILIEGVDITDEIEFRETDKKPMPNTKVGPPRCQTGDQQVTAMSSCFTVDTWKIFVPRGTRAALCRFVDDEGKRLTNVRPLFENVIQETSCRLLDKTVVRDGVEKRVVRATLKLSALSSSDVSGTATVRVVALYR